MSDRGPGRPVKYKDEGDRPRKTSIYVLGSLLDEAKLNGLNLSEEFTNYLLARLNGDILGIEQLRKKEGDLKTELIAIRRQIQDKERIERIMQEQQLKEEIEGLVSAYWLRQFNTNAQRTQFKKWASLTSFQDVNLDNFAIRAKETAKIRADSQSGLLLPNSPLEKWAEYELIIKDPKMKQTAREELIKELSKKDGGNDAIQS